MAFISLFVEPLSKALSFSRPRETSLVQNQRLQHERQGERRKTGIFRLEGVSL